MVQTPQVFDRETLVEAYMRAFEDGFEATDDSQLIERLGIPVAVVPGERDNIKLTYPEDFRKVKDGREASERVTVTGIGFDVHPFAEGRPCVIGGVTIPLRAEVLHADALFTDGLYLSGLRRDIGQWFPSGVRCGAASLPCRIVAATPGQRRVVHWIRDCRGSTEDRPFAA